MSEADPRFVYLHTTQQDPCLKHGSPERKIEECLLFICSCVSFYFRMQDGEAQMLWDMADSLELTGDEGRMGVEMQRLVSRRQTVYWDCRIWMSSVWTKNWRWYAWLVSISLLQSCEWDWHQQSFEVICAGKMSDLRIASLVSAEWSAWSYTEEWQKQLLHHLTSKKRHLLQQLAAGIQSRA